LIAFLSLLTANRFRALASLSDHALRITVSFVEHGLNLLFRLGELSLDLFNILLTIFDALAARFEHSQEQDQMHTWPK
jgi:hypothetical protein